MISLFLDTHGSNLAIGIVKDDKLLIESQEFSFHEHSSKTLPTIEKLFNEINITPNDIDQILVVTGPGSYTGLRIGVTIAKTYGYTLNKKVIPVSSLKARALSYKSFDYIITKLDAKRDHFFAAIYDFEYNEVLTEQYISKVDLEAKQNELKGEVIEAEENTKLDILNIVKYYELNEGVNPHELVPNYLKEVHITESRK